MPTRKYSKIFYTEFLTRDFYVMSFVRVIAEAEQ